jgi:hypothetical protein
MINAALSGLDGVQNHSRNIGEPYNTQLLMTINNIDAVLPV